MSSINPGFAASGGTPDYRETGQGTNRMPELDFAPAPVGIAGSNRWNEMWTDGLIRSSSVLGQGHRSRDGAGDIHRGGMMPC